MEKEKFDALLKSVETFGPDELTRLNRALSDRRDKLIEGFIACLPEDVNRNYRSQISTLVNKGFCSVILFENVPDCRKEELMKKSAYETSIVVQALSKQGVVSGEIIVCNNCILARLALLKQV